MSLRIVSDKSGWVFLSPVPWTVMTLKLDCYILFAQKCIKALAWWSFWRSSSSLRNLIFVTDLWHWIWSIKTATLVWSTNIMGSDKVFVLGRRSFVQIRNKCSWLSATWWSLKNFNYKKYFQSILQEQATGSAG